MSNPEKWHRFKELPPEIQETLLTLPTVLANSDVLLAYLFGSLAQNLTGNDVDLALLTRTNPPHALRDTLTRHLGTERIDIIDLHQSPPALCFEIIRSGQPIYIADEEQRLQFELAVVRRFHDTAYLRQQQERLLRRRMAAWSSDAAES